MRILSLAAAAAFLASVPAAAQRAPDGLTGTRVRVTAPNFLPSAVTGTVASYTQTGIVVVDEFSGDSIVLPLRAIQRLDTYAGSSAAGSAWYRGRVGGFIGGALGLIAGPLLAKTVDKEMVEATLLGGAIGLGAGFTVGALYGAATPRERWRWNIQPWGYDPTLRPPPPPPAQIPPPPPAP